MFCQIEGSEVVEVIPKPKGITIGDTQYPKNIFTIWSKEELKTIGLLPYSENKIDNRFYLRGDLSYDVGSDAVVGTYAKAAKDIDEIKDKMIERVKKIASKFLAYTDWMVIRESEGGTAIPDDIKAYRTAVRKESNDKETAIKALSDLDAVMLYEATPYIETRKNDAGENVESEYPISLTNHYFAEDPLAEV
ncbi:uncharacterized protein METZ01_LOCUS390342, partial [marine metagenome]